MHSLNKLCKTRKAGGTKVTVAQLTSCGKQIPHRPVKRPRLTEKRATAFAHGSQKLY